MKDLTQKLIDDYRPYIKASHWTDFVNYRHDETQRMGPVVNILKTYSEDGKRLIEKVYQRSSELGTPYGFALNHAQAGVDSLPE